jgi:hypothetical protein
MERDSFRVLRLVLVLALVALTGCNLVRKNKPTPTRAVEQNTPATAALRYAASRAGDTDAVTASFSAIHTWALGQDSLVAFSYAAGYDEEWLLCNGQARVTLASGGWQVVDGGTRCWDDSSAAVTGVYAFITDDDGAAQTVIYGDVLVEDISAVSVEFAVGGESAVAEIDDAGYWLMLPEHQTPARAIAIDTTGYLVQMFEFGPPLETAPAGDAPATGS